jgi:hypothetical protein
MIGCEVAGGFLAVVCPMPKRCFSSVAAVSKNSSPGWPSGKTRYQPRVPVRQLRDWFAQFPYLSKLRDPQVLAKAIGEALARSDTKYAIADRLDDAKGEYVGFKLGRLVEVDLNSEVVLVRREVADAQLAKQAPPDGATGAGQRTVAVGQPQVGGQVAARPRPRRFYAKVTLDPNRPTPQVSNIAQSILSERPRDDDHAYARHPR